MGVTEAQIKAWLNNPASGGEVYGRNWDQKCQALIWQLVNAFGTPATPDLYPSAAAARAASTIVSTDPSTAPPGAIHYWDIGAYGHDGVDLAGGGTRVLMATGALAESWANHVGVNSVAGYSQAKGATYRGWSHTNGKRNTVVIDGAAPLLSKDDAKLVARYLNTLKIGKTTTTDKDGIPGSVFYWLAQAWGAKNGHYPQPAYKIDGKPGPRTNAIVTGPLLAAAKAWATPPVTPPPAWVPPTKAQYDALVAELGTARSTITGLNTEVAAAAKTITALTAKIDAGRKALA